MEVWKGRRSGRDPGRTEKESGNEVKKVKRLK